MNPTYLALVIFLSTTNALQHVEPQGLAVKTACTTNSAELPFVTTPHRSILGSDSYQGPDDPSAYSSADAATGVNYDSQQQGTLDPAYLNPSLVSDPGNSDAEFMEPKRILGEARLAGQPASVRNGVGGGQLPAGTSGAGGGLQGNSAGLGGGPLPGGVGGGPLPDVSGVGTQSFQMDFGPTGPFDPLFDPSDITITGTISVIHFDYLWGVSHNHYYLLPDSPPPTNTPTDPLSDPPQPIRLQLAPALDRYTLYHGAQVSVRTTGPQMLPGPASLQDVEPGTDFSQQPEVQVIQAKQITLLSAPARPPPELGQATPSSPYSLPTAVILLDLCGFGPAMTLEAAQALLTNPPATTTPSQPPPPTLQSYLSSCTYSKLTITPSTSITLGPIPVACPLRPPRSANRTLLSALIPPPPGSLTCTLSDVETWISSAVDYITFVMGIDLAPYKHRIYVLPACDQVPCNFSVRSEVGCSGGVCNSVVKGSHASFWQVHLHALGHQLGLQQGRGADGRANSDITSAMSGCCSRRCLPSPNLLQLGVARLGTSLNASTLPPGRWVPAQLPGLLTSDKAFLQVTADWVNPRSARPTSLFADYRTASGPDTNLPDTFSGTVTLHAWAGLPGKTHPETHLLGVLSEDGQIWRDTMNLRTAVQLLSRSASTAQVSVCRMMPRGGVMGGGVMCQAGVDSNCDGVYDVDTAACRDAA